MKIDNELKTFLEEHDLEYKIEQEDHPACWGKSCEGQHLISELKVWKTGKPQLRLSFGEGLTNGFIIGKIFDRGYALPNN